MDNLSYSSEENMSGSSEKCKDGTWHLEMNDSRKNCILHLERVKTKKK
jgi:hypothetical protein